MDTRWMETSLSDRNRVGETVLLDGVWWTAASRMRDPKTGLFAVYLLSDDGAERVEWEHEIEQ